MVYAYAAAAYLTVALATFGYYSRTYYFDRRKMRQGVIFGLAWPIYWPVIHGVAPSLVLLLDALGRTARAARLFVNEAAGTVACVTFVVWGFGIILAPSVMLYFTWDGSWPPVAKALLWAPFWPGYVLARCLDGSLAVCL